MRHFHYKNIFSTKLCHINHTVGYDVVAYLLTIVYQFPESVFHLLYISQAVLYIECMVILFFNSQKNNTVITISKSRISLLKRIRETTFGTLCFQMPVFMATEYICQINHSLLQLFVYNMLLYLSNI